MCLVMDVNTGTCANWIIHVYYVLSPVVVYFVAIFLVGCWQGWDTDDKLKLNEWRLVIKGACALEIVKFTDSLYNV